MRKLNCITISFTLLFTNVFFVVFRYGHKKSVSLFLCVHPGSLGTEPDLHLRRSIAHTYRVNIKYHANVDIGIPIRGYQPLFLAFVFRDKVSEAFPVNAK
jgi:hypothetical protein